MKYVLYVILVSIISCATLTLSETCDSKIYCQGPLLHTVQMARIFEDSKTFVDMKMKKSYALTLINFEKLMCDSDNKPSVSDIKKFVEANFEQAEELELWLPPDFKENPTFLKDVPDPNLRSFAQCLIKKWVLFARKVKPEVIANPSSYSLIPVPNGFIISSDRFREYYYWDSYWIVKGLILTEMPETAKGIINNFFHVIKNLGFIPNGGRIYYTDRSQPPLLARMVWEYYIYTKNKSWLKENIEYLDTELSFWLDKKSVEVKSNGTPYKLAHYSAESRGPRPESYFEDYLLGTTIDDDERREQVYTEIKTEAESGWDLSSRWVFDSQGGNNATQREAEARRVIPVDLNSLLCEAFQIISTLYLELGKTSRASFWKKTRKQWVLAMENLFWDAEDGIWYDLDLLTGNRRRYFYASNVSPLWCKCLKSNDTAEYGNLVLKYLSKTGALATRGGIPVSFVNSGEQWDYPNGWPPIQEMIIEALEQSGYPEAVLAAKSMALKFLKTSMDGFHSKGRIYEKYDVSQIGKAGQGGEYPVQTCFGWTTATALNFIAKYRTFDVL